MHRWIFVALWLLAGCVTQEEHEQALADAQNTLEASVVNRVSAAAGLYGDGVAIVSADPAAWALVDRVLIADTARAGLANFGADVSLANSAIRCAAFDIEAEQTPMRPFMFDDRGGNRCGCPMTDRPCTAVSAGLAPPEGIGSVE